MNRRPVHLRMLCKTCHRVLCVISMKRVIYPGGRLGWPAGIPAPEIQIRMGKFMGSWDFKGIVLTVPKKQREKQPTPPAHPNFCFLSLQRYVEGPEHTELDVPTSESAVQEQLINKGLGTVYTPTTSTLPLY